MLQLGCGHLTDGKCSCEYAVLRANQTECVPSNDSLMTGGQSPANLSEGDNVGGLNEREYLDNYVYTEFIKSRFHCFKVVRVSLDHVDVSM